MIKVSFVKESRQKGYTVIGLLRDGEIKKYTLSNIVFSELGSLLRGDEIDGDTLETIEYEDECFRALKRALSLLSYSDNSERTLTMKLLRAGFSRRAAEEAVRDCAAHGFIKEKEQILRLVATLANTRLYGAGYIRKYLLSRGYSQRDINEAISELVDSGEIDFDESFRRLAEKKGVADPEQCRMLAYKYGFKTY